MGQQKDNSLKRRRFFFWLDEKIDEERALVQRAKILKKKRIYTRTLREALWVIPDLREGSFHMLFKLFSKQTQILQDALRLLQDLRAGRLDVLFEMFPELQSQFKDEADEALAEKLDSTLAKIEKLVTSQAPVHQQRAHLDMNHKPKSKSSGKVKREAVKISAEAKMAKMLGSF